VAAPVAEALLEEAALLDPEGAPALHARRRLLHDVGGGLAREVARVAHHARELDGLRLADVGIGRLRDVDLLGGDLGLFPEAGAGDAL